MTVRTKRRRARLDPAHFARHSGLPGHVYVARADEHGADIFKVGYTTRSPDDRVKHLNDEQRRATSGIARFRLVVAVPVADAYGAEQAVLAAVRAHRISKRKEFVRMPLVELQRVIEEEAAFVNERTIAFRQCPACKETVRFVPQPGREVICNHCAAVLELGPTGLSPQESRRAASDAGMPRRIEADRDDAMQNMRARAIDAIETKAPAAVPTGGTNPTPPHRMDFVLCPLCKDCVWFNPQESRPSLHCGRCGRVFASPHRTAPGHN